MLQIEILAGESYSPGTRTHPSKRGSVVTQELSRGHAFVLMSSKEQRKFVADRFKEMDSMELAYIVRAIFGHPEDKGRGRKSVP
jgi:hypothetical protein